MAENKDEAKEPKKDPKPDLKVAKPKAADKEPEAAKVAPPADRSVVIITNGSDVRLGPSQLSGLEICEACRRLVTALGG